MDCLVVNGGRRLQGKVAANGSKNSSLKMLFAALLSDEPVQLNRVPILKDVETSLELLRSFGVEAEMAEHTVRIHARRVDSVIAPYDLVRTMRASIISLGPLLAREGKAKVSLPGGCAIGTRPVDLHLKGLEALGAEFTLSEGYVIGECPKGLHGADFELSFASVGATENIMLAATLAKGKTILRNAAREPEIADLAAFLNAMGAQIKGAGTSVIEVEGVERLKGCTFNVMFDRIEAATLLLAGAITGGDVTVTGTVPSALGAVLAEMHTAGIATEEGKDFIRAQAGETIRGVQIRTEPFPGFPTDVQAQIMAYLAQVQADSRIEETIFENRFMHVPELVRLGADIRVEGNTASIHGVNDCYSGATVMATDLRASASLVLAGLAGKGKTKIRRIYHLDRGYESIEKKLESLGAEIRREPE